MYPNRGFLSGLPRRPFVRLIALLALVQTTACYSHHMWTVPIPQLTDPLTFDYRGEMVTLEHPRLEADSSVLVGWQKRSGGNVMVVSGRGRSETVTGDSLEVQFRMRGKERGNLQPGRTALTAVGVTVGVLAAAVVYAMWNFSPLSGTWSRP